MLATCCDKNLGVQPHWFGKVPVENFLNLTQLRQQISYTVISNLTKSHFARHVLHTNGTLIGGRARALSILFARRGRGLVRGPRADPVPWQAFMQTMMPRNGDLEFPKFLFQRVDKGPRRGSRTPIQWTTPMKSERAKQRTPRATLLFLANHLLQ